MCQTCTHGLATQPCQTTLQSSPVKQPCPATLSSSPARSCSNAKQKTSSDQTCMKITKPYALVLVEAQTEDGRNFASSKQACMNMINASMTKLSCLAVDKLPPAPPLFNVGCGQNWHPNLRNFCRRHAPPCSAHSQDLHRNIENGGCRGGVPAFLFPSMC